MRPWSDRQQCKSKQTFSGAYASANAFRIGTMYVGVLATAVWRNYDRDHGTATVDWQSSSSFWRLVSIRIVVAIFDASNQGAIANGDSPQKIGKRIDMAPIIVLQQLWAQPCIL